MLYDNHDQNCNVDTSIYKARFNIYKWEFFFIFFFGFYLEVQISCDRPNFLQMQKTKLFKLQY